VEILRLPLSGLLFQRRPDGAWRSLGQAQHDDERSGRFDPGSDDWTPPDEPIPRGGRAERAPGSHAGESWWLLYGDRRDGPVTVTLADGRTPPILTFGPLWICEWVSTWQRAVVTTGRDSYQTFHRRANYLRAADPEGP
jgi:hypothetical protein